MGKRMLIVTFVIASVLAMPSYIPGQSAVVPLRLSEPYHQAQFPALLQGGFKYWDKGYLITYAWNRTLETLPEKPGLVLYDSMGQISREAIVWLGGSTRVSMGNAALSGTGQLVASGSSVNQDGTVADFLALIGNDNRIHKVVRTTPFMPIYICALPDGTAWTYGVERDDHLNGIQNSLRLRHYSFEKGQLKALLDASALGPGEGWLLSRGRYPGEVALRCNARTVALLNGASSELIEVDLRTNSLKVTPVEPLPSPPEFQLTGFALTDSGSLFASFCDHSRKPAVFGLLRLARGSAGAQWLPVEGTVGPYQEGSRIERLLGADGDDLVYTGFTDGKLFWSKLNSN